MPGVDHRRFGSRRITAHEHRFISHGVAAVGAFLREDAVRKRTLLILALAFIAAAICAVLLQNKPGITDDVRQLKDATIPPGATLIESPAGRADTWSF